MFLLDSVNDIEILFRFFENSFNLFFSLFTYIFVFSMSSSGHIIVASSPPILDIYAFFGKASLNILCPISKAMSPA